MTSIKQKTRSQSLFQKCCFVIYLLTVLWFTVGRRKIGYYPKQLDFFWSYKAWFRGDWLSGSANLANIAMFVPFGFLVEELFKGKKRLIVIILLSLLFSVLVETTQFILMRGYFELDDVFNNVFGAILGTLLYRLFRSTLPEKLLRGLMYCAYAFILLFCFVLYMTLGGSTYDASSPLPQGLCFQVDQAISRDGTINLDGFCFWYEQDHSHYNLILQSAETGKMIPLKTESGLKREDVSAYFHRDDIKPGFHASGQGIEPGEYEIILDFGLYRRLPTSTYLSISQNLSAQSTQANQDSVVVHDLPAPLRPTLANAGPDLQKILSSGIPKASHPENHVYVYWYDGCLYWIVEDGFTYEKDGTTRLELILWSSNKDLLPEKVQAEGKDFHTVGIDFEPNELKGDFGEYRVTVWKAEAPYPISMIRTGVYAKGGWVWQDNIRPFYHFFKPQ